MKGQNILKEQHEKVNFMFREEWTSRLDVFVGIMETFMVPLSHHPKLFNAIECFIEAEYLNKLHIGEEREKYWEMLWQKSFLVFLTTLKSSEENHHGKRC